jgi:hypothetical protein
MDLAKLALREYTADLTREADLLTAAPQGKITRATLRRCRTREQGIALMTVGHAIEYLVQSRLIDQKITTGAEREAMAILLNANLAVYNEGTEIVPMIDKLRRWFHGGNSMKASTAAAH